MIRSITKKIVPALLIMIVLFTPVAFDKNIFHPVEHTIVKAATDMQGDAAGPGSGSPVPPLPSGQSEGNPGGCGIGIIGTSGSIVGCFVLLANIITSALLTISSWVLWASGAMLKVVIDWTVVNMSTHINQVSGVNIAWKAFRDMANMFFIFILLYIAIGTILRLGGINMKKMLATVIITALLLNFSLFFTKIMIDVSNIVTTGFYNKINPSSQDIGGLAIPFMNKMNLPSVYNPTAAGLVLEDSWDNVGKILLVGLLGSIFFIIAACVFFAANVLFISRFVSLVFLLIFSPLAFAAMALPKDKYSNMWWERLTAECIFAPVFMALMWVDLQILSGILDPSAGGILDTVKEIGGGGTPGIESLSVIMNFIIVIALMTGTLIVSKKLGASGAESAMKAKGWATGFVGRNTAGRLAYGANRMLDGATKGLEQSKTGRRVLGGLRYGSLGLASAAKAGIETGATAKFGGKISRKDAIDSREKEIEKGIKDRRDNPRAQAGYLMGLSGDKREKAYEKMSARDRAEIEKHVSPAEATRLRNTLSTEEKEKTGKAEGDAKKDQRSKDIRTAIDEIMAGRTSTIINPRTNAPYTIIQAVTDLPVSQARKLNSAARKNPLVISNLSVRHLADLMKDGDLQPDEIGAINNPRNATARQIAWMNDPKRADEWRP